MTQYHVEKGVRAVVFKAGVLWTKANANVVETKYSNTFEEKEMTLSPHVLCETDVVRAAYSVLGYYGFDRSGFIMLVPVESVTIIREDGAYKEDFWEICNYWRVEYGLKPLERPEPEKPKKRRRHYEPRRKDRTGDQ